MPAFDEAATVAQAVRDMLQTARSLPFGCEVLVVDDGSRDATPSILADLVRENPTLRLVTHPVNQGLGGAIRTGIRQATGLFVVVAPVDNPLSQDAVLAFMGHTEQADLVLGYREQREGYNALMRFNSWLYHRLLRAVAGLPYRDVNWIHLYRRAAFANLPIEFSGIAMQAELVLRAHALGYRIIETPCPMVSRKQGQASARRLRVMARTGKDLVRLLLRAKTGRLQERPAPGDAAT